MAMKTIVLTGLALFAFAANSVLCRLALANHLIDAGSFTSIRLFSGVLMLWFIVMIGQRSTPISKPKNKPISWYASIMLFLYAITFSYAYIELDTGTGALILFGAGQITLISYAIWQGKRLNILESLGLFLAGFGFVYLMLPSASSPSLQGFILMSVSGAAWGFYTILGQGSQAALLDTAVNFKRSIPFVLLLVLASYPYMHLSKMGVFYAVLSGAIASGLGYTFWYMAVVKLQTLHAAVVQLFVPVIAAVGGYYITFRTFEYTTDTIISFDIGRDIDGGYLQK
jgi:drug/metabolite transporter (DMT)-like permease